MPNHQQFEDLYCKARDIEGRLLSDQEVRVLPQYSGSNKPLHKEWMLRRQTVNRFFNQRFENVNQILDVGCGNGWFTNLIALHFNKAKVLGLDINRTELAQASRVHNLTNLSFNFCDIFTDTNSSNRYDLITINAAIQYFPSLKNTINRLLSFLKSNGTIIILDSPFYSKDKIAFAIQRSEAYYQNIGVPNLAKNYFSHSIEELHQFDPVYIYKPNWVLLKLKVAKNPFPIIKIQKKLS